MLRKVTLLLLLTSLTIVAGCQDDTGDKSGATTPAKSGDGKQVSRAESAMLEEAAKGNTAAVKGWLDKGVAVNMRGSERNTPLMEAAYAGHLETVKLLLDYGADLGAKKNDGATPVALGARNKDIDQLFKNVAALIDAARKGDNKAVRDLIDKGTPVNGLNEAGQSALTEASWNGLTETVKLLLEKGANPTIKKSDGESPLSIATAQKHTAVADLLTEAMAKRTKDNATATPSPAAK